MTSKPTLAARARRAALAAAIVAAVAPAAHAETGAGTALKNTAIAGSVATWAVALFNGAPVVDCLTHGNSNGPGSEWGVRLQGGTDAELKYAMLAAERRPCDLTNALGWSLDVSPIAGVSYWEADSGSAYSRHAWDVAYVPMMHWRHPVAAQTNVDVEFGIGPAYLSEASIGDRQKSTNFQFSDHFGIGLGSSDGKWRVGFEFRHISNLSIQTPNAAVDYKGIAISYRP
jgi:hypothetical protein